MPETNIPNEILDALGASKEALEIFLAFIRHNYEMDELWTSGKDTGKLAAYRNELKFRRGGKTLVTLYMRDGFFNVTIILGKDERVKVETRLAEFSDGLRQIYSVTETFHDGKWLTFDVRDTPVIEDLCKLLLLKRKPSKKGKNNGDI
jgi:hypothetical protein